MLPRISPGRLEAILSQLPAHGIWLGLPQPLCLLWNLTVELAFWLSSPWLSPRQAHLVTRGDREQRDIKAGGRCLLYIEHGHASTCCAQT